MKCSSEVGFAMGILRQGAFERHDHVDVAAIADDSIPFEKRADHVREMLEDVAAQDEVLAPVGHGYAVARAPDVDGGRLHAVLALLLGVKVMPLAGCHVAHPQPEGIVRGRADLEPVETVGASHGPAGAPET